MTDLTFSKLDPDPIATALATEGPKEFHKALQWVECKTRHVKDAKLPSSLRMIRVLWYLEMHAQLDRVLYCGAMELGPYVPEAAAFCRTIGAEGCADALDGVVALFPAGMPRSVREYSQAGGYSREFEASLAPLDAALASSFPELNDSLRRWLASNRAEVQAEIDRINGKSASGGKSRPASKRKGAGKSKGPSRIADDDGGASALDEVLAVSDPDPLQAGFAFLSAAADWVASVPGRNGLPLEELPETARMISLLNELVSALNSAGLLYVADWELGNHFAELLDWTTQLHATSTHAYLQGFAGLFPRGRVPKDRDKRSAALKSVVERAAKKGGDPLDALDEEFRERALLEIPTRMREWFVLNRARLEQEQSSAASQPAGSSGDDLILKKDDMLTVLAQWKARRNESRAVQDATAPMNVGDVVSLETPKGYAYLQVTHDHHYADVRGPVLRVIEGLTKSRLAGDALAKHVAGPTRHFTLLHLERWLVEDAQRLTIAGRALPVPDDAKAFPPFLFFWGRTRDNRAVFGQWEGGAHPTRHVIAPLSEEELHMNVATLSSRPETMAEDLAGNWSRERDHMLWY